MAEKETYLGDGLYASFDGWQIYLRAPREDGDHFVALDAHTWMSLMVFADNVGISLGTKKAKS